MAEIPTKPFFLSIEKDHEHPKLDIFVVHLFYLIKYARGQLEYHEEPFFTGRLEIFFERSHWRPFRFYLPPLAQGMDPRYLDDRLFAKLAGAAQFCALPETADAAIQETLQDLLQTVQATKVEQFTFCESCLRKNKFTFLDPRSIFRGTNGVKECRVCAGADLLVRVRDVVETSPNLRNLLRDLLNKFKDVDKVANLFATNIHSLADPSRTLYDSKKEHHQKIDQKKVTLDQLPLPSELISRLAKKGFTELLPAQVLAVEAGLLEGASELIISSTSSGKTLIAELAGIPKLLQHAQAGGDSRQVPKLLYVVPLVALANQRGDEWAHRYRPLGISLVTKVGVKQFDPEARAARSKANKGVQSADIIVGTYEGVDVLVRKGRADLLGNPATIVIDEIQMLGDPERGWFLDGFISRLRSIYPRAQFLYLSATISEPQELSAQLQAVLVEYNGRPVPIERHFILCATRDEKTRVAGMLIKNEFGMTSKFGYKGQTIVFTNSRRNCHKIASTLQQMGISAAAYHAGLTYGQRRRIEKAFIAQSVMAVVTTAALGAGLDLPASQVIFESLAMGRQWLSVAEFEQFSGRAGRLGKHERGKVVVLAEPGNQVVPKDKETEEQVALRLFKGKILPLALEPDDMRVGTEILAFLATTGGALGAEIDAFYRKMYHRSTQPDLVLRRLATGGYTAQQQNRTAITPMGRAVVEHFLTTEDADRIREMLVTEPGKLLDFALEMRPFENLYVSNKMVSELAGKSGSGGGSGSKGKDAGNHLYSALVTDMLDANSAARHHHKLKGWVLNVLANWATQLFNCECKERPECDCARLNVERRIYALVEAGLRDVPAIAGSLRDDLELALFPGDILSYLDALIHSLRAIFAIGKAGGHESEVEQVPQIIHSLTGVENWDIFDDPDAQAPPLLPETQTMGDITPVARSSKQSPPRSANSRPHHGKEKPNSTVAPGSLEVAKLSPPPRIQRPAPLPINYPKRSPVGKRKKNAPTTAGLSVEEFVAHIDELAEKAVEKEPVPAAQQEDSPKKVLPPKPIPTQPPVTLTPPKEQKTPKKTPKTTSSINTMKRSTLGKLERKKKKHAKDQPPDE